MQLLLNEIRLDVNQKTDILAIKELKCDFIEINIRQLIDLVLTVENLSKEYSEINLDALHKKQLLFLKLSNLKDVKPIEIRTSDDILINIKNISSITVPNDVLTELLNLNYSDIYSFCLIKNTSKIIDTISRIVDSKKYILESKFNITKSPPFLILREQPQTIKTKSEILRQNLNQNGFFELEKVKVLSVKSQNLLIDKIIQSKLPYVIAMFEYLLFIKYLEKERFPTKYKLHIEVSKWFSRDKDGRAVRGNLCSLSSNTTESKSRYTAIQYKESVIKDYEQLK